MTYHDTTEDPSPTSKLAQLAQVASSVVVHEPLHQGSGVKAIYWRQGVPEAARQPMDLHTFRPFTAYPQQPILGTIGFNFPWKNYDRLCQTTADLGWALLLLANNATEADVARWTAINPYTLVMRRFLEGATAVDWLAGCDATAFMYECANTGTSGAIRLGIAARKPVIALDSCRQFRDLYLDHLGTRTIQWVRDWSALEARLIHGTHGARYDPGIVALAHQESWRGLGQQYAQLYRMLVGESRV